MPLTACANDLWSFAVTSMRALDIVEQHANLLGRKGLAALGNSVALKANNTAQAGQVVRDPVVGLGHPDDSHIRSELTFFVPFRRKIALQGAENQENNSKFNMLLAY